MRKLPVKPGSSSGLADRSANGAQQTSHFPAIPPPVNVRLVVTPTHACTYLPGRTTQNRAIWADTLPPLLYHQFMDAGFRRSGKVLYQPVCRGCRECRQMRVPVATFTPSKSQRRCWRRNADLRFSIGAPQATDEKFDLYRRYLRDWHGRIDDEDARDDDAARASFESFLYDSPVETIEFEYRDTSGRLLGIGLCDVCPESLSTVYFYHDPAESRRGVGTYSAMVEIEHARALNIPYYYLGFWVRACGKMAYKSSFGPNEVLGTDGIWRTNGA